MKVRDVMQRKVVTVTPETTYEEAARIMYEHKFSGLPVINGSGRLVGIVSEKDLFRALYPRYEEYSREPMEFSDRELQEHDIDEVRADPISGYMVESVVCIDPGAPILKAGGLMLAQGVHRLPVVDNGTLVGIVTREDIYSMILKQHLDLPQRQRAANG